ncbi:hypothetical protein UCRPC4_g05708 [Phaeomoniella chlamydospora]|uniref:Uncharacterized protein n=1 Tax=Phaeomoniella chlamydospora TaxID=158046 RepID=A0A0G2E2M4_PHACM|nr:hypothetical protein UCRPC4_g05708 [Phaeomoniella chlamydospora]
MSPTHHGDPKSSKSPEYAPHFKEDFGDDRASLQPASTGYLHTFASQSAIPYPDHDPPALPAFARGLPTRLPDAAAPTQKALPSLPKAQSPPASPPSNTVLSSSPPGARRLSAADPMIQASGLPKHMTSKSSRFSFDLNGVGSAAQEKLLEEKHKEKEASRNTDFNVDDADAVELDEYADYGFDEDDGLEERIPGINVDADELDELSSVPTAGLQHFHFTPSMQSTIISPTTQGSNQTSFPTPRDEYGHAIGFAMSKESPSLAQFSPHFYQQLEQRRTETLDAVQGLGISSTGDNFGKGDSMIGDLQGKGLSDEDMYFDDGDIDLGSPQQDQADFDESIFDDDTGKIRDIPAENARKFEVSYSQGPVKDDSESSPEVDVIPESGNEGKSFTQGLTENALSGLTEGNMAAFQKALESIANEATAKDQLELVANISQSSDGHRSASRNDSSHPGLVSDDSRVSQTIEPFSTKVIPDDYELEDDNIDDDLLIAEANAEALENDDEGFYGREFGFYARANPKSDNEMVNGGFFIPRGMEGVHRSHSGRANFQEPTLTPITERSEWSTRNSMASISAFGIAQSAHSLPSPALADLLGQTGLDEDLSLGALLRLRRGAWGGSQTSLHSSAPSQVSSSPQTHTSPREHVNPPISIDVPATMSSSAWSLTGSMGIPESEEEDEEGIVSPTVTQNTPRKGQQSSPSALPFTPVTTNPYSQRSERPKAHSRTSSGADSVSYVKDPDGRFIVERKRTLDSGEIELIGREVLVGNI